VEEGRRNVAIIGASWTIMRPFSAAVATYSSLYFMELGASPTDIGFLVMLSWVILAFSRLIGGHLTDTVGRKKILVPMTILYGVSNLIYVVAPSWIWLIPAQILTSIALMYQPAVESILADSLPPERRGKGMSVVNTVSSAAGLVGPPMATLMVSMYGIDRAMRYIYAMSALSMIAGGLLRMLLKETLKERKKRSFWEYLRAAKLLKGSVGKLVLIQSAASAVYQGIWPFLQVYSVKFLGISAESWGWISSITGFVGMGGMLLSGYLTDRIGRNKVMFLGYLSGAVMFLLFMISPKKSDLFVFLAMLAGNLVMSRPASFALLADLTPLELRGRIIALRGLIAGNAMGIASQASGVIYEESPRGLMAGGAAVVAVASISALLLLPSGALEEEST